MYSDIADHTMNKIELALVGVYTIALSLSLSAMIAYMKPVTEKFTVVGFFFAYFK